MVLPTRPLPLLVAYPVPEAEIPAHGHLGDLRHGRRLDHVPSALLTCMHYPQQDPSRLCHPQQLPRSTIPAGLGLLLQKHEPTLPWSGQCSGCDGDGDGSQSFRDRDGDTEKQKQRGSIGREAGTMTNSWQRSSGGPHPAPSGGWAPEMEGGPGLFQFA